MSTYQLSHLSDGTLLSGLKTLVARERETTAELLAHVAEVDQRKLYLPAAYPSMFAYCVGELRLSEDAAAKRIQAARAARRFPAIFDAVASGRLHLTGVGLLAPHLTEHTAEELLGAAAHRAKAEIERLLAERFPQPDVLAWVQPISGPSPALCDGPHTLAHVGSPGEIPVQHAPAHVDPAPGAVEAPAALASERDRLLVKPLAPQRFALQCTIDQETHDLLRYAQDLLSHQIPPGDIAKVLGHVLRAAIPELEKSKFAATEQPRPNHRHAGTDSRTIPANVRRAVWERDQGQCTFCEAAPRIKSCFVSSCS